MDAIYWILGAGLVAGSIVALVVWRPIRAARREKLLARARRDFHRQREQLEARFLTRASACGKPRGLRWSDCNFEDDVTYARDRRSKRLSAFVAVTIRFEAIEGGGMEENENVRNLRAATAVFDYDRSRWTTDGRAIFNLNPAEAIQFYQANLELVAQEAASSR
ncbi:MAG TPA: hypothetical protein VG056_11440 [Pirellulales bacterium]|jgi:hypothetical protein|nr:hypothetical protein [Pirellulales bacterium]